MSRDVKRTKSTGNVFRDLGYPEPEARNLTLRSDLLIAIEKFAKNSSLTQTAAAKQLGITQLRLNQLLRGHLDRFSLDALVEIATSAGLEIRIVVRRAEIIQRGLKQAITHPKGRRVAGLKIHIPPPVDRKKPAPKRRIGASPRAAGAFIAHPGQGPPPPPASAARTPETR